MRKLRVLETFRFIGAIIIALGHFFDWNGGIDRMPRSFILSVEFFFILSAFVIVLKQNPEKERTDEYLKNLFFKRTIRLLLPYMILLIIYYLFFFKLFYGRHVGLYNFIINLFLLQILGLSGQLFSGISQVAWTLGLEYWGGTVFFSFIHYMQKKFKEGVFFIAIMIYVVSIGIFRNGSPNYLSPHFWTYSTVPFGILRMLASFSIGTLCAIFYKKYGNKKIKEKKIIFSILEILIVLIIIRFYGKVNYNRENDYVFPIIGGIFILIFSYEDGIISKILKPFSILGALSYSIYLIHLIVMELMRYLKIENQLSPLNIFLFLSTVIVISFLFHYFIERKMINLKYRLIH